MDSMSAHSKAMATSVSALLREHGITHEAAAEATGIPYRTMRRRLAGIGKAFDIDELAAIADLLDVDIAALVTYAATAEPVAS